MAEWSRKRPLMETRAKALQTMHDILDAAELGKRDVTAEEDVIYAQAENGERAAMRQLEQIASHERAETSTAMLDVVKPDELRDLGLLPGTPGSTSQEQRAAEQKQLGDFRSALRGEARAIQQDNDIEGGYLVAPMALAAGIIIALNNDVYVRGIAHKEMLTSAQSLGIPTLDTDLSDADWTAELTQTTVDTAMRTGRRELHPKFLTKETKVSRQLVRTTAGAVESLVLDRLAYKFAVTEEQSFLTGSGSGQPLGVFTASASGISTGRDVSTDNTTTSITGDGLINAKYSLAAGYMRRAQWIFHRDAIKQIRKLKDGEGNYLWRAGIGVASGLASGTPDVICDLPYSMSEYAPHTFTTGLYVGVLGDFENYWIADALDLQVQVLNELYARTNQFGYIGRLSVDGMPVLEEAFARVKLA